MLVQNLMLEEWTHHGQDDQGGKNPHHCVANQLHDLIPVNTSRQSELQSPASVHGKKKNLYLDEIEMNQEFLKTLHPG